MLKGPWGERWSGVLAPLWVTLIEKAIVASPLYTFEHEYDSKGKWMCLLDSYQQQSMGYSR